MHPGVQLQVAVVGGLQRRQPRVSQLQRLVCLVRQLRCSGLGARHAGIGGIQLMVAVLLRAEQFRLQLGGLDLKRETDW